MPDINPIRIIRKYGLWGTFVKTLRFAAGFAANEIENRYYRFKHRKIRQYRDPESGELHVIEQGFKNQGVDICDFRIEASDYNEFKSLLPFPADYHGGVDSGVWEEKIVEHYIAYKMLELRDFRQNDIYVDVAACNSPWARILRDTLNIQAFAIDLALPEEHKKLDYYRVENATKTSFPDSSVKGVSLHCAFEMFAGDDDVKLIRELQRILRQGGKAVIVPLYMHTHYCCFASPEYWGKGHADSAALEYVRLDMRGIPSARNYDVVALQERILRTIENCGMHSKIYVLRNGKSLSPEVYCHFILEITK